MSDETTSLAAEVHVTTARKWFVKAADRMSNMLVAETEALG